MTELQIILLICAVVFVGALWWWGKRSDQQVPRKGPFRHQPLAAETPEEEGFTVTPITTKATSVDEPAFTPSDLPEMTVNAPTLAPFTASVDQDKVVEDVVPSVAMTSGVSNSAAVDENALQARLSFEDTQMVEGVKPVRVAAKPEEREVAEVEPQLFALLVLSHSRDLSRVQIHTAMEASRLVWLAHEGTYANVDKLGNVVFRVANAVEPGFFPALEQSDFTTPGIALVLNLPTSITPYRAMDEFITVARKLNQSLDGKLYDSQRHLIKESDLRAMREYAQTLTHG